VLPLFCTGLGTVKWRYQTNAQIQSCPAIGSDGTIYVGSNDRNLHAVDSSTGNMVLWFVECFEKVPFFLGTSKWKFPTSENVWSSAAVGSDGTIYVGSNDNNFYAIDSAGISFMMRYTVRIDSVMLRGNRKFEMELQHRQLHRLIPDHRTRWYHLRGNTAELSVRLYSCWNCKVEISDWWMGRFISCHRTRWYHLCGIYWLLSVRY